MRLLALFLLLSLFQSPTFAPIQQEARKKLCESNVPFTPDAFIQSVIAGDTEKVDWFLKAGMSPDVSYKGENPFQIGNRVIFNGDPALIIAMNLGHEEIISLLLSQGVNINNPSSLPASPLMVAKVDFAKSLLDKGADINWRGYGGNTVLMDAVINGELDKVKLLLEYGADINAKNDRGWTVIQLAAIVGQREVFTFLRAHGADTSNFSERSLKRLLNDPDPNDEILSLIRRLRPVRNGNNTTGPSVEDQRQIPGQLLKIAGQSAESRAQVIDELMDFVDDISAKEEIMIATAWMTAVDVLGDLKATEAVEVLVNNLDHTGQNGLIMSIHIHPVYSALVKIGEPAVPKLVEALAHPNPFIRTEAVWVLYSIQKGRAKEAIEAAIKKETDEEIKRTFKGVLDRIDRGY